MSEDEEELPLLLKEIITLEFSNPKVPIYIQKETRYFGQNLFPYFFLITKKDSTWETKCIIVKDVFS